MDCISDFWERDDAMVGICGHQRCGLKFDLHNNSKKKEIHLNGKGEVALTF